MDKRKSFLSVVKKTCDEKPLPSSTPQSAQRRINPNLACFIAMNPENYEIVAESPDAAATLGSGHRTLLGCDLFEIHAILASKVAGMPKARCTLHHVAHLPKNPARTDLHAVVHDQSGVRVIEFLQTSDDALHADMQSFWRCAQNSTRILQAATFQQAMDLTTKAVRDAIGSAHSLICMLHPDGSAEVVAEVSTKNTPPALGDMFAGPNTANPDHFNHLPPQRTQAAVANFARDAQCPALDLSCLVTHLLQPALTAPRVDAMALCTLMHDATPWGTIALHPDGSAPVSFDQWRMIQQLGAALMVRYDQMQRDAQASGQADLLKIEANLAAALRQNCDLDEIIAKIAPDMQALLDADGFALGYGTKLFTCGETPTHTTLAQLCAQPIRPVSGPDFLASAGNAPSTAPASDDTSTLFHAITGDAFCKAFWFKKHIKEPSRRTGGPSSILFDPQMPRAFHATCSAMGQGKNKAWERRIRRFTADTLDAFFSKIDAQLQIKHENDALLQFTQSAAHDLKAPVRGIGMALEMMRQEHLNPEMVAEMHSVAEGSAKRLSKLLDGLLEFAVIGKKTHPFAPTDLEHLLQEVCGLLDALITTTGAIVRTQNLPVVSGNAPLLLSLFLNLVENALKYKDPDAAMNIDVALVNDTADYFEIAVTDTGVGVAPEFAERIFKPMHRLHTQDDIEGSGLGLTICERIAAIHHGSVSIDPSYTDGARFILRLGKRHEPQAVQGL